MSLKSLKKKVKLDHQGQILNITYKYSFRRPLWLKDWCSNPVCEDGVCGCLVSCIKKIFIHTLQQEWEGVLMFRMAQENKAAFRLKV